MSDANISYQSRRDRNAGNPTRASSRKGSSKVRGRRYKRKDPNYGNRALLLSIVLPFVLLPAVIGKTFLDLCGKTCSFSSLTPPAVIAMWVLVGLAAACIFALIYNAAESVTNYEKKVKAIIAVTFAGLLTGAVLSGLAQDIIADLAVSIIR